MRKMKTIQYVFALSLACMSLISNPVNCLATEKNAAQPKPEMNVDVMPAHTTLHVNCKIGADKAELMILNSNGQMVMHKDITSSGNGFDEMVDISALMYGQYTVQLKTQDQTAEKQIIKR